MRSLGESTKNRENRREGLLLDVARGESFGYQARLRGRRSKGMERRTSDRSAKQIGGRGKRSPANTPLFLLWRLCKFVRGRDYMNTVVSLGTILNFCDVTQCSLSLSLV